MIEVAIFRLAMNLVLMVSALYAANRIVAVDKSRLIRSIALAFVGISANAAVESGLYIYTQAIGTTLLWGYPVGVYYTLGNVTRTIPVILMALELAGVLRGDDDGEAE